MQPISVYTREDALQDGALVDVTKEAKESGFKIPVAMTAALYGVVKDIPKRKMLSDLDSEVRGRLHDLLTMTFLKAKLSAGGSVIYPSVLMAMPKGKRLLTFKAVVHSGDNREPVMTIMREEED